MVPGWFSCFFIVLMVLVFHDSRFHGFLWFQVDFHGSRLVFHGSRWVFMVFHGSRTVYHDSRLVLWFSIFHVGFSWFKVGVNPNCAPEAQSDMLRTPQKVPAGFVSWPHNPAH